MNHPEWTKEFPAAINICDKEGTLLSLNDKAIKLFEKDGGENLIGKNIIDCHPGKSRGKLEDMLKNASTNCYIVEKKDSKRFIFQAPWFKEGEYMGIVEMIMEIPSEIIFHKVEE
jgi:DUF438 domain-containing protein